MNNYPRKLLDYKTANQSYWLMACQSMLLAHGMPINSTGLWHKKFLFWSNTSCTVYAVESPTLYLSKLFLCGILVLKNIIILNTFTGVVHTTLFLFMGVSEWSMYKKRLFHTLLITNRL